MGVVKHVTWTMQRGSNEFKNLILSKSADLPEADVELLLRQPLMNELLLSGLMLRLVIMDTATGKYVYASPGMDEYFDPEQREAQFDMGWNYVDSLIHPDDSAAFGKYILAYGEYLLSHPPAEQANCRFVVTYRIRNRRSEYRRLLQQVYPFVIRPTDPVVRYLGVVLQDVTLVKSTDEVTAYVVHRRADGTDQMVTLGPHAPSAAFAPSPSGKRLSQRELDVLRLVMAGHSNREVAEQLSISLQTVISHRRNLMRKTRCTNAAQLALMAVQAGLV